MNTYDDAMFPSDSIDGHFPAVHDDNGLPDIVGIDDLSDSFQYDQRIWKAGVIDDHKLSLDRKELKVHIVVSHSCSADLYWISNYTKGFDVASIHVISKCEEVVGAP